MEGSDRPTNADIANTLHLKYVAMASTFWLLMGYNFDCVIANSTIFDSRSGFLGVKLSDEVIAEMSVLRDV